MAKNKPTQAEIESYRAVENDDRTLAVSITAPFLKLVNVAAAKREMMVRDFVIESILKNLED